MTTHDQEEPAPVRVAWAADAAAIAELQVRAWQRQYGDVMPPDVFDVDGATAHWRASLSKPGDARNRVLVANGAGGIDGFTATGPCTDPDADQVADGEIMLFVLAPELTGQEREDNAGWLLHAAVDTLRADGFTHALVWLLSTEDELRELFAESGWAADGAHRELESAGEGRLKQVRLHVDLSS